VNAARLTHGPVDLEIIESESASKPSFPSSLLARSGK